MMTKKIVFQISLTLLLILGGLFFLAQFKYCDSYGYVQSDHKNLCMNVIDYAEMALEPLGFSLFLIPLLFLLSLITYRMHDSVFRAWWNFARWMVPIIIITTIFFETRRSGGGGWGISSGLDEFVILSLLYIILIFTSIWKILGAHDKLKKK